MLGRAHPIKPTGYFCVLLGVVLFAVILGTLTRVPFVNCDEVYFADPALNFLNGEGFVSRAWDTSPDSRTVASTSPLYGVVLTLWSAMVGWDLFALRVLGVILTACAMLLFYLAMPKWRIELNCWWGVMLLILIPLMFGYAPAYRAGRPEPLVFLIWAGIFYIAAGKATARRDSLILGLAALMPFAGQIASLALGGLVMVAALVWRKEALRLAAVVLAGLISGGICFVAVYRIAGIYPDYVAATQTVGGGILERIVQRLTHSPFSQHRNTIPKDPTLVLLYANLALLIGAAWKERTWRWRSVLTCGTIYAVTLPFTLYVGAKFPTYYSWILTVPLATVVCHLGTEREKVKGRAMLFHRTIFFGAAAVGLPLQLLIAIPDWRARDHEELVRWSDTVLRNDDVALVGYPQYFAARRYAKKIYLYGYGSQLTEADISSLTVLVMPRMSAYGMSREALMERLGPDWVATGEVFVTDPSPLGNDLSKGTFSQPNYDAEIYRRRANSEQSVGSLSKN